MGSHAMGGDGSESPVPEDASPQGESEWWRHVLRADDEPADPVTDPLSVPLVAEAGRVEATSAEPTDSADHDVTGVPGVPRTEPPAVFAPPSAGPSSGADAAGTPTSAGAGWPSGPEFVAVPLTEPRHLAARPDAPAPARPDAPVDPVPAPAPDLEPATAALPDPVVAPEPSDVPPAPADAIGQPPTGPGPRSRTVLPQRPEEQEPSSGPAAPSTRARTKQPKRPGQVKPPKPPRPERRSLLEGAGSRAADVGLLLLALAVVALVYLALTA